VRMRPRANPAPVSEAVLGKIVGIAFSQRRKMLRATLGKWLAEQGWTGEFDGTRRAEQVPVEEYVALALALPPDAVRAVESAGTADVPVDDE